MSSGDSLKTLEMRLAHWRTARWTGPGWMRKEAGKVIKDLEAEIADRRRHGEEAK